MIADRERVVEAGRLRVHSISDPPNHSSLIGVAGALTVFALVDVPDELEVSGAR